MSGLNKSIKLGVAPTRRKVFSGEDAGLYKDLILETIRSLGIDFIDLQWLNDEGLLFDPDDVDTVAERFRSEGVDALFTPHCNFGTEEAIAKLGRKMGVPLLLWGPRDEAPLPDGTRLRDSQCGLFATSKVLQRMDVPFTYIENCRVDDPVFAEGMRKFVAAAAVVKSFRNMKIGQIDTRPGDFWSVICNEGELLERFNIEVVPITLIEIVHAVNAKLDKKELNFAELAADYRTRTVCDFDDDSVHKMIALKHVIREWAESKSLTAVAFQCWDALQDALGIMPCFINSELTGEGLPVVCETDVCGAVSAVITEAAMLYETPVFFADVTIRHPENDQAELLWHCGPFPLKLIKEGTEPKIGEHYVLPSHCPGVAEWEIKGGDISICRFDGVKGKYSIMVAEGIGIDGPRNRGTYVWVQFKDWPALERKLIYGPYIHHVAGIHGKIAAVVKEALRYLPDIIDDIEE